MTTHLAAAHALLAELLETDEQALRYMKELGLTPSPVLVSQAERIRQLLIEQGAYREHVCVSPG